MEVNTKLERAYQKGETSVTWEEDDKGSRKLWTININRETETDGITTKEVKRRLLAESK